MSLDQWKEWDEQGFIPGPDETEAAFVERIAYCQNLEQNLISKVGSELPFEVGDKKSKEILQEALPLTEELYGINPQWVPLFFSNYQLAPWHGGCAWIFQLDDQTPTAAFLQLRAPFRSSPTYLGLYHRRELIAHELSHVGRMLYQEPQFEEVLAYRSSASRWRRLLGPIVQSSKETLFFILVLGVVILSDFALLSIGEVMASTMWFMKLVPIILIGMALVRLFYRHYIFNRCLHNLSVLYPSRTANHLIYRLQDREIKQFSRSSSIQIQEYIEKQLSFRWIFFKTLYLAEK